MPKATEDCPWRNTSLTGTPSAAEPGHRYMATRSQVERALRNLDAAKAAGRARRARGELAASARYDPKRKRLEVELLSGSAIAVPVAALEGLSTAAPAELREVRIVGDGYGLHWPRLDVDLSVLDLFSGIYGTKGWMSALARRAGQATSEAKAAAARENGRLGGRPRKGSAVHDAIPTRGPEVHTMVKKPSPQVMRARTVATKAAQPPAKAAQTKRRGAGR